jgi:hypothetical protein
VLIVGKNVKAVNFFSPVLQKQISQFNNEVLKEVFLKLSSSQDYFIGRLRTRGPLL